MSFAPRASIDLSALQHNLERVRMAASGRRIMAVVKANGYGHGMARVARALAGADALAVARIGEAVALRRLGINQAVVVLEGCFDAEDLRAAAHYGLELVVHEPGQIQLLEQNRPTAPITCWLKVDTGMHRLGIPMEEAAEAYRRLVACASVAPAPRIMTHLACADDRQSPVTQQQWERLKPLLAATQAEASVANSGGILGWPDLHAEWVRPGIMLYGVSPFIDERGEQLGLRPVMTLQTRLIAIQKFHRGDAIGYGGTWICPQDMSVGVAAVGYGDGYPRHAPSGTSVLVNGCRTSLVGRVSMDTISLDLRTQPEARVGDCVTLWGEGLPVEEIAEAAGTIPYELLCGVTGRVEVVEGPTLD